jgi:signal peptidase I
MKTAASPGIRYPLFSMWIWPQAAIRRLVGTRGPLEILALAAIAGIYVTMLLTVFYAPGIGVALHSWQLLLIGAFAGVAGLYIAAALAFLAGKLLGGTATYGELRRALAWMAIPNSFALTLLAAAGLALSVLGFLMSPSNTAETDIFAVFVLMVLSVPLGLWGMVVSIRALAAVQNFGAFRSALNLALVCGVLWYGVHALGTELHARLASFVMPNDAMLPTRTPFERFLTGSSATLERGDVVVFARMRNHPHYGIVTDHYVKRVVGLPGDQIAMTGGVLSINGEVVKRQRQGDFAVTAENGQQKSVPRFTETMPNGVSYDVLDSDPGRTIGTGPLSVPAGQYFLLGDNRDNAKDSPETYQGPPALAHSGLVRLERLRGKALLNRAD